MSTALLWFRRDLRLSDNPALLAATRAAEEVIGVFCLDDRLWRPAGAARRAHLVGCLRSLDAAMGGELVIRHGDPAEVVPALAADIGAGSVHVAEDFGPYGRARDDAVAAALAARGIDLVHTDSPYAVPPGSIFTKAGTPYKVFTPFSRLWRERSRVEPAPRPSAIPWGSARSDPLPDVAVPEGVELPRPGEDAAGNRLDHFLRAKVEDYDDARDFPGRDATSRLSADLKWGTLHPRQILSRLGSSAGEETLATELCWREFYADVLFHAPESAREPMDRSVGSMPWDSGADADDRFEAWARGRTGYPIVDAGMRQLATEAWMHNRVRMIVASFLVKDLHLDWRRGARWFMEHLVDADLAWNQHGWQWTAGTGTDAVPFFRIFNPITQGQRFDPDGAYIRRYVPELAGVAHRDVHQPWMCDGGPPGGYPRPIVDHAEEREEALARYAATR